MMNLPISPQAAALELLRRRQQKKKLREDPAALMESCGLPPDPWQVDFLRGRPQRGLLLCSRQAGKSTTTAAMSLHEAIYNPNSLVLLLSRSLRQSSELFRKVISFYYQLKDPIRAKAESALRLELSNGSRIVSLPGDEEKIRGYSGVSLLVIDEASRVPDELYYSVRPMLAVSGGRLVSLSTPWGKRGWFHQAYTEGGDAWQRYKVTAHECPRISPEFLEEEKKSMPEAWFRSEYLCEFTDAIDQCFTYDQIMAAMDDGIEPLFGAEGGGLVDLLELSIFQD